MAIVTKTISTTVSNGVFPCNYTWSSDCDSFITYGTKTGIINSNGTLSTTITYDDINCLQCTFYIDFNYNNGCTYQQDTKGIKQLSCGNLNAIIFCNSISASIIFNGTSILVNSSQDGYISNIMFGTYTFSIEVFGVEPNTCEIIVNGVSYFGNGFFNITVTTDYNNPNISIVINYPNC